MRHKGKEIISRISPYNDFYFNKEFIEDFVSDTQWLTYIYKYVNTRINVVTVLLLCLIDNIHTHIYSVHYELWIFNREIIR